MKFNPIVDDANEKFEVAHAVIFQTLQNKHIYQQFSQLQSQYTNYFIYFFFNGMEFSLRHLDWCDFIDGNYLKESLIGIIESKLWLFVLISNRGTYLNK